MRRHCVVLGVRIRQGRPQSVPFVGLGLVLGSERPEVCAWDSPGPLLVRSRVHGLRGSSSRTQHYAVCIMYVVPVGVRVLLPRLLLYLLSTLRLAELGLEAHVPRSEACGAVVVSAFAVVLGELVRRCCANGRRTLWNRVLHIIGRWVGGASAHSSSTLAHLASSSTYAPTSRGGLVRPTSSCAPRLARRVRRSTRSPKRLPFRGEKNPEVGVLSLQSVRADLSVVLFSCICVV